VIFADPSEISAADFVWTRQAAWSISMTRLPSADRYLAAFGFCTSALLAFSRASSLQMRGIQWRSRACLDLAQDSYGKRFGTEWDMEFHNGANRAFPPRV
jgi:hypothetical protein